MIRTSFILLVLAGLVWIMLQEFNAFHGRTHQNQIGTYYAEKGMQEVGAANLVTAVVVTYRGFDTLGEVTILFLTAAIVGLLVRKQTGYRQESTSQPSGEILQTASKVLLPVMLLTGVYVFINGHLTPGGGFQGGAILASAVVLAMLAFTDHPVKHKLLDVAESISGIGFVFIGILGIVLAGGFLDNKILPLGEFGSLISAGAIPVIYSLIGLKVGSELSSIVLTMQDSEKGGQDV